MIRKLRMKFVGISMGSLVLVIVLLMGLINFLNYRDMVKKADHLLDILTENDGSFPAPGDQPVPPWEEEKLPEIPAKPEELSPETPFETRFFLAKLRENGEILSVDTGKIAAVDKETASDYTKNAWEKGKSRGFIGQYRYHRKKTEEGYLIVFLDCNRVIDSWQSVLLTSIGVSGFGIFLVFLLIYIFSGIVMKPVYESYEKQKRFITDAGHEIRTPLTIIDADMDVLGMDIGENEWLEDMRRQTGRLTGLTNDLIYLARMEEGSRQMQMIDLPFSDLVEETAQSFQALAIVKQKVFSIEVQPMLMLCGEEKALRKLVAILLDNAVKYSDEKGRVSLKLERSGRMIRLSVFNTTEAIAKESIGHLFERFYRADASRNFQTGGYGIGLSIAEAIVQAHRGEIHAATKDGHSLQITVLLPVK